MIRSMSRRARQVLNDPVLRRWLLTRALGRAAVPASFTAHKPPYLRDKLPLDGEAPTAGFVDAGGAAPTQLLVLPLPGFDLEVDPSAPGAVFERAFDDIETELALHRFAWVPLLGAAAPAEWIAALWREWVARYARPDDSWAWHPYTASERAINVLDLARRRGLPGPARQTLALLADHAPAIADRLEYFGEPGTGNHLANNGRGLYRLGRDLGLAKAAELGRDILLAEAERIFLPSGILREGSSHYHLLYVRAYLDVWLCARRHGAEEDAARFAAIAGKALSVVPALRLPGGFPLVGDVSPDCPPDFLLGIEHGAGGWADGMEEFERAAIRELAAADAPATPGVLDADGWWRLDGDGWAGLWHASPDGWPFIPGHGHQDFGAFELHFENEPLFVDPGRGAYGETGQAALYRSSAVHGTLRLDGQDPYPPNKPYYDDKFRRAVAGPPPVGRRFSGGLELAHHGFARIGAGKATRRWLFSPSGLVIDDHIEGTGRQDVERSFVTPLPVSIEGLNAVMTGRTHRFVVRSDGPPPERQDITLWSAYGKGKPGSRVVLSQLADLPWRGSVEVRVEAID